MKRNRFSLRYFVDLEGSPDFIFLNECLLFQFEAPNVTDILKGEYSYALSSDDISDPELPFIKNRSNGGTMILWKHTLDPFVTVLSNENQSFLAILFKPPDSPPSLHVSLYLPTSGKESEFIEEVTKLEVFLQEMSEMHPSSLIFIRGDSNVNMNNKQRVNIFNNFKSSYNLNSVCLQHKTYHHFLGNGLFDSNIDVLLHNDAKDVTEEVSNIYCQKDYPQIGSHHDVIASYFTLPRISAKPSKPVKAPIIPNTRTKTVWSTEAIPVYQSLIGQSLSELRDRWYEPGSRSCVSMLVESSSDILNAAARFSNTTISLSRNSSLKSVKVPRAIKTAQNRIRRICKTRSSLPSTDPYHAAITANLVKARKDLRRIVRSYNGSLATAEDQNVISILSSSGASSAIYRKIRSLKSSSAKKISFLKVGSDEYHGDEVKTGFFKSISSLKKRSHDVGDNDEPHDYITDYEYILELCQNKRDLPPISIAMSTEILTRMKYSVNDYYSITPAHYLNAGEEGLDHFNRMLNIIIDDVNNATIEELNACYALLLHKGHGKSRNIDTAYRTISTCPMLSRALDLYIRSLHKDKWNACQAKTQYQGEESCHELAGLLLTELVQHSLYILKEPAYFLFLDAKSAFDCVLPELLIRNLFMAGMDGNTTVLINNRLVNRRTYLDWDRTLMGPIKDELGLEQGGSNSSDYYKIYSNENLKVAQKSLQGIPLNKSPNKSLGNFQSLAKSQVISAIGLADDTVLSANKLSNLSNILSLTQNYCKRYGVTLSHEKTKLVKMSRGNNNDHELYNPICIDTHNINFSDSAEHVGIIRSNEGNMPHIINRIRAHRNALRATLSSGMSQKSRANPLIGLRLQCMYGSPVLLSGVACLVLTSSEISTIDKHLKETHLNIQKLPKKTPRAVVHFLGGSLPGAAAIHLRILSLFGMVARLRGDPLHIQAENVLTSAKSSSKSWFRFVRDICLLYELPHPLTILEQKPSKQTFKKEVKAKVVSYWETKLRGEASLLPSLKYFHPEYMNLTKPHPIWSTAGSCPYEISKAVQQARFLSGRYRCANLTKHWSSSNSEGYCASATCYKQAETIEHILVQCRSYSDCRRRLLSLWLSTPNGVVLKLVREALGSDTDYLVQFILDCSVLPHVIRETQLHGPEILHILFHLTRSWCFSIHRQRMKNLGRWNFQ